MAHKNYFPFVLKATAAATAVVTVILALLYRFFHQDWMLASAISTITTCYHFSMRLAVGYVIPHLVPENVATSCWFCSRAFESKLYKTLNVKHWKNHMPTYNPSSFSIRKNTLEQIIYNSCVSEAVHEVIIVFSFVPLLFALVWGAFPVFLVTSILSGLFDSCFVIMQRYNRPRLVRILAKKEAYAP